MSRGAYILEIRRFLILYTVFWIFPVPGHDVKFQSEFANKYWIVCYLVTSQYGLTVPSQIPSQIQLFASKYEYYSVL